MATPAVNYAAAAMQQPHANRAPAHHHNGAGHAQPQAQQVQQTAGQGADWKETLNLPTRDTRLKTTVSPDLLMSHRISHYILVPLPENLETRLFS
jgi:hypothetical protein